MTTNIADDVVAIKARLDEIEREKDAARTKQVREEDKSFEQSPWTSSVLNPDNDVYC